MKRGFHGKSRKLKPSFEKTGNTKLENRIHIIRCVFLFKLITTVEERKKNIHHSELDIGNNIIFTLQNENANANHFSQLKRLCASVDLLITWHLYDLYSIYLYLL